MLNRIGARRLGRAREIPLDVGEEASRRPSWRAPSLPLPRISALVSALPITAVLLLALAVNLPTLNDYFHGDDFVAFTELGVKDPVTYMVDTFLFNDVNFYWRPLGQASYLALYHAFGLEPVAFHGLSIVMFLATVWLLYRFCINAGLSKAVGVGAAAIFALFPNHVVSVAWVTNSPRVMAVMFFMLSLVLLQRALQKRSFPLEAAAWLVFLLCPLADETSLALAPVPVLYSMVHTGRVRFGWDVVARAFFYLGTVAALGPLQFMFTLDDEPRLGEYAFGGHVFTQVWVLTSHLALPLAEGSPLALSFQVVPASQWIAGGIVIALGALLLVAGSWKMRFLALWTAAALAPFTLWNIEWFSPRYVYMAALPFAITVSWLIVSLIESLRGDWQRFVALGACALVAAAVGVASMVATVERNDAWAQSTEPFRTLATKLPEAVPEAPPGARFVIYYGTWQEFDLWPRVVLRTIYRDEKLDVISIDRRNVDSALPRREARDIVVYYSDGEFLRVPPETTR